MKITDIITSIETVGDDLDQTNPAADTVADAAPADDTAQVAPKKEYKRKATPKGAGGFDIPRPKKAKTENAPKAPRAPKAPKEPKADKGPNKKEAILALLRAPEGATIDQLMAATGWQKHSVHGQLANLRKAGTPIQSTVTGEGKDKVTTYTLAA